MDKNTIWAIVLSTLVIVGSYFLLPKVFGTKKAATQEQTEVEVVADDSAASGQTSQTEILTDTLFDEETSALLSEAEIKDLGYIYLLMIPLLKLWLSNSM